MEDLLYVEVFPNVVMSSLLSRPAKWHLNSGITALEIEA